MVLVCRRGRTDAARVTLKLDFSKFNAVDPHRSGVSRLLITILKLYLTVQYSICFRALKAFKHVITCAALANVLHRSYYAISGVRKSYLGLPSLSTSQYLTFDVRIC